MCLLLYLREAVSTHWENMILLHSKLLRLQMMKIWGLHYPTGYSFPMKISLQLNKYPFKQWLLHHLALHLWNPIGVYSNKSKTLIFLDKTKIIINIITICLHLMQQRVHLQWWISLVNNLLRWCYLLRRLTRLQQICRRSIFGN